MGGRPAAANRNLNRLGIGFVCRPFRVSHESRHGGFVRIEGHLATTAIAAGPTLLTKMIPTGVLRATHANPRRFLFTN
jgi:hypothetical protein